MGTSKYIKIKEESLEQLKKYIDALPVASGIYEYKDEVWTDIFLNKKMLQIIGQSSDENELLCKNDPWKFVHEQDFETLKILLDDLVMYEKEVDYSCRINSKRGASLVNIKVKTIDEIRGKDNDSILVSCIVRELTNLEYELETLYEEKKDNNILTSLTEDPGGGILKYYFKTDIFELYNTSSQNTIYMNKDSFSLENIIDTDWIASESLESLQDIYSKLRKGIPKGSTVLRIKNSHGEWNWYLTKYTTLFNDVLEPEYSMIYYKNVTSIRKENMASKRLHDLTKVGINNVFFHIEYNVSLDIFEEMVGTLPEGYCVNPDFSGIKNVKIIARNIHPEDRGEFLRLLSIKHMERSCQRGLCKGTLEFRARYKGGYAWVQLIYHLLEEPYSSNIIIWLSLKRINEKNKLK